MTDLKLPYELIHQVRKDDFVDFGSDYSRNVGDTEEMRELNRISFKSGLNPYTYKHWVHINNQGFFIFRTLRKVKMTVDIFYKRVGLFRESRFIKIKIVED